MNLLSEKELHLTGPAERKMAEMISQIEEDVEGIRVLALPGGCSGVNYGMTFADKIEGNDLVLECDGMKLIVGADALQYLRGAQIDFVSDGNNDGQARFVFNNIPQSPDSSCGVSAK